MLTKKLIISFLSSVVILLLLLFSVLYYVGWLRPVYQGASFVTLKVKRDATLYHFSKQIQQRGWVSSSLLVRCVAEIKGVRQIKRGEYLIRPGMTLAQLIDNLSSAKGLVLHKITFIEGTTFRDYIERLNQDDNIVHTLSSSRMDKAMQQLGLSDKYPEGLFFPDTYRFTWGTTDRVVLKMAYNKMQRVSKQLWKARSRSVPYASRYEALIAASMIQSEAGVDRERPIISSVIVNRLRKGMRLQIDPTVMYGLDIPFGGRLSRADLNSPNSYNTYRHAGLPPTPINMPGRSSIYAALHPSETNFLYYVASHGRTHTFSSNYSQHKRAVKSYRKDRAWVESIAQKQCGVFRHVFMSHYAALVSWFFCFG